jgi:hypothetical protein
MCSAVTYIQAVSDSMLSAEVGLRVHLKRIVGPLEALQGWNLSPQTAPLPGRTPSPCVDPNFTRAVEMGLGLMSQTRLEAKVSQVGEVVNNGDPMS